MSRPFTIDDIHKLAESGKIRGYVIKNKREVTPNIPESTTCEPEEKRGITPKKRVPNKEKSTPDEISAKEYQRYANKSHPQLLTLATKHFNAWIRHRDSNDGWFHCISCGQVKSASEMHASHYMSAGHHSATRFNEDNVHGSCVKCNTFLAGNLIEYRKRLIKKIGEERVEWIENLAKSGTHKHDKSSLIEIIIKYKKKIKKP